MAAVSSCRASALPVAALCLALLASQAAAAATWEEACAKMPPTWAPLDETSWVAPVSEQYASYIYKEALTRYNASNLNITWTPYVCETPTYDAAGCYQKKEDGRLNYMLYMNSTCTYLDDTGASKSAKIGVIADASWYNGTGMVYDVDVDSLWIDGEKMSDDTKSVWWEKNDESWYPAPSPPPMMDEEPPMTEEEPALYPPPPAGGYSY